MQKSATVGKIFTLAKIFVRHPTVENPDATGGGYFLPWKESHNITQRTHSTQNYDLSKDENEEYIFWLQNGIKIQSENLF